MLRLHTILLLSLLLFCSCSSIDDYTSDTLSNQGILPLSSSNSYLGTNLYLAKQAEKSRVLYNFLETKGGPTAIQLIDKNFETPRLLLFYAKTEEAYSAELEKHNELYQWIVRGPYAIKRSDYLLLARIQTRDTGDPLFIINGNFKRFRIDREKALATPTPYPTPIPTPIVTAIPTVKKIIKKVASKKTSIPVITAPTKKEIAAPSIKDFKPLNTDQQAIQMSKGFAERADNGDLIHVVKKDGEAITSIAKWYTGSEENSKVILSANGIQQEKTLVIGQRIRIPLKVLTNLKAM